MCKNADDYVRFGMGEQELRSLRLALEKVCEEEKYRTCCFHLIGNQFLVRMCDGWLLQILPVQHSRQLHEFNTTVAGHSLFRAVAGNGREKANAR